MSDCIQSIPVDTFQNARIQLDEVPPNDSPYDDYFDYLREVNDYKKAHDWKEALD